MKTAFSVIVILIVSMVLAYLISNATWISDWMKTRLVALIVSFIM